MFIWHCSKWLTDNFETMLVDGCKGGGGVSGICRQFWKPQLDHASLCHLLVHCLEFTGHCNCPGGHSLYLTSGICFLFHLLAPLQASKTGNAFQTAKSKRKPTCLPNAYDQIKKNGIIVSCTTKEAKDEDTKGRFQSHLSMFMIKPSKDGKIEATATKQDQKKDPSLERRHIWASGLVVHWSTTINFQINKNKFATLCLFFLQTCAWIVSLWASCHIRFFGWKMIYSLMVEWSLIIDH